MLSLSFLFFQLLNLNWKGYKLLNCEIQQNVELLLQEMDSITVNIPKLKLLRQYHGAAVSWISHFNDVCVNIHEREDQENVVDELKCILKQGLSMIIQGLPLGMCIYLFIYVYYILYFIFKNSCCSLSWFLYGSGVWSFYQAVDELPLVEVELKKAYCRKEALQVFSPCYDRL